MDDRFLARREAVRLSHLLQHRLAVGVPVTDTDARIALLNGWSAPESWGVWTDGKQAEFGLALPRPLPSSPVLQVTAEIMPPPGGRQVIRLEGNQLPLGEWRLGSGHAVICAALPQQVTAGSGLLRLSVGIGSPQRPPGGVDTRDLGLGVGDSDDRAERRGLREGRTLTVSEAAAGACQP